MKTLCLALAAVLALGLTTKIASADATPAPAAAVSTPAAPNCDQRFVQDKSPIFATHLFDTGDYQAISTGNWDHALKIECSFKANIMRRVILKGPGFAHRTSECTSYQLQGADLAKYEAAAKAAATEPEVQGPVLEGVAFITTMWRPGSADEFRLQGLSGSPAVPSVIRNGSASTSLINALTENCALAEGTP